MPTLEDRGWTVRPVFHSVREGYPGARNIDFYGHLQYIYATDFCAASGGLAVMAAMLVKRARGQIIRGGTVPDSSVHRRTALGIPASVSHTCIEVGIQIVGVWKHFQ